MTILLAYSSGSTVHDESTLYTDLLPIGLCSLHALLRTQGYAVQLANLSRMTPRQIDQLLRSIRPALLGLSQWTHNRHATTALARRAKQLLGDDCTVVLGGGHASHEAETVLTRSPEVDLIVIGEGEATLPELIEALRSGQPLEQVPGLALRKEGTIIRTATRPRLTDLDRLPYPARFLDEALGVDIELQAQFISTSRGCPSACRFCSSPTFWGRAVQTRSPASVVDEFLFLRQRFGTLYVSLRDDTFTADRARTIELCRLLIERRAHLFWNCQTRVEAVDEEVLSWMKRAGCECVQLGVESGSPRILKELGKRITPEQVIQAADAVHRVGLHLSVYLIAAVPDESEADRQATRDLVRRIKPHDLQVAPLAYYPGTALFNSAVRHGTVSPALFAEDRREALVACRDGEQQATKMLQAWSVPPTRQSNRTFAEIRQRVGYCAVNCQQAGDYHLQRGDWKLAEAAYREICETEPDHPWGWLLLAELYDELGRSAPSQKCYRQFLKLVPHHRQAQLALQAG